MHLADQSGVSVLIRTGPTPLVRDTTGFETLVYLALLNPYLFSEYHSAIFLLVFLGNLLVRLIFLLSTACDGDHFFFSGLYLLALNLTHSFIIKGLRFLL